MDREIFYKSLLIKNDRADVTHALFTHRSVLDEVIVSSGSAVSSTSVHTCDRFRADGFTSLLDAVERIIFGLLRFY